jgi:hypothetical protein
MRHPEALSHLQPPQETACLKSRLGGKWRGLDLTAQPDERLPGRTHGLGQSMSERTYSQGPYNALQRTHSPVTSLAEKRKRRARRRATDAQRSTEATRGFGK